MDGLAGGLTLVGDDPKEAAKQTGKYLDSNDGRKQIAGVAGMGVGAGVGAAIGGPVGAAVGWKVAATAVASKVGADLAFQGIKKRGKDDEDPAEPIDKALFKRRPGDDVGFPELFPEDQEPAAKAKPRRGRINIGGKKKDPRVKRLIKAQDAELDELGVDRDIREARKQLGDKTLHGSIV